MFTAEMLEKVQIFDADSHVSEPPDLWTSRMPAKYLAEAPHVERHPTTGHSTWRMGDHWLLPVGHYARAGWPEYPPSAPKELEDVDAGSWNPHKRLERLDEYGLYGQVLYPNIIGFEAPHFMRMDREVSLACTTAYNDFLLDFAAADPKRLIPIAMVPFWDVEGAVVEMKRAAKAGHKGFLFGNVFEQIGLPGFLDPHWDPIYQMAQECDLTINYHVGFSAYNEGFTQEFKKRRSRKKSAEELVESPNADPFADFFDPTVSSRTTVMSMLTAIDPIAKLVCSDLPERFPELKHVFVESGFGYVPFLLESLDWHWKGYGAHFKNPTLPSENFRKHCFGSFWFETCTLRLLDLYPDNFMFETDYPHPTGMSPGPASPAERPADHVARHFAGLPKDVALKALNENARRLYKM